MNETLDQAQEKMTKAIDLVFGVKVDIVNDGKRLVVEGLWSLTPKVRRGWTLVRKQRVPDDVKAQMEKPRDYDFVTLNTAAAPLDELLAIMLKQYAELRIQGAIDYLNRGPV